MLVTAVRSGADASLASGIRKLKRGCTLSEFISAYMHDEVKIKKYTLFNRDGTMQCVSHEDGPVSSFSFTAYPEDELLSAVSNLTKEELLRDLKELLPLKAELL